MSDTVTVTRAVDPTELRRTLKANGYGPVPVTSPGALYRGKPFPKAGKAPLLPNWQRVCADASDSEISSWSGHPDWGNTGILCGNAVGVDIDVLDEKIAAEIEKLAHETLGVPKPTTLRRTGRQPKLLLLYRADTPFKKIQTDEFLLPNTNNGSKVEILADGEQFVAFGTHPVTGKPYEWAEQQSPLNVRAADLPVVTVHSCKAFVEKATEILTRSGGVAKKPERKANDKAKGKANDATYMALNTAALMDISAWAPDAFPKGRPSGESWRVSSKDLGRDLEEDLSIHPDGIRDFGDEVGLTPVSVLVKFGRAADAHEAALWLCERLGRDPEDVGVRAPSNLPRIRLIAGELPRVVDDAEAALINSEPGLYQYGSRIVHPVWDKIHKGEGEVLRLHEVQPEYLTEKFEASAQFEVLKGGKSWAPASCPDKLAKTYLARPNWRLPRLHAVVTAPTLRPDGTILDRPGFDAATNILFDPVGVEFPPVPERPTKDDALAALGKLKKLIATFPFVTDADRSVSLSAIMTAVIRRSLSVAPMHAFDAPVAGSGKSKLVDIAAMIATGSVAPVTSTGRDKYGLAELEKRLVSSMLEADAVINIDNVEGPLEGELLCQLCTQPVVKLRPLGRSINVVVPNTTTLCATGNNLMVVGDMTRRALVGTVDPKVERPELREFSNDPVADARHNRADLVVAVLTIIRAFIVAGSPSQRAPLGSFDEWSHLVRDPLIWLDEADPVDVMEKVRGNDPKLEALRAVMAHWNQHFKTEPMLASKVIEKAVAGGIDAFRYPEFRDALRTVAKGSGREEVSPERLGLWLKKNAGRAVSVDGGTFRLVQEGESHRAKTWVLQPCGLATPDGDDIPM